MAGMPMVEDVISHTHNLMRSCAINQRFQSFSYPNMLQLYSHDPDAHPHATESNYLPFCMPVSNPLMKEYASPVQK